MAEGSMDEAPQAKNALKHLLDASGIILECLDCGAHFSFSKEEQAHYAEKGYQIPKRCVECRRFRRAVNAARLAKGPGGRLPVTLGRRK